jgi:ABC-type multidrug transport system ATPase subunit
MVIQLTDIGKRYGFEWIFKGLNYQFISGEAYAITGPNGSGKSTLLKVISGGLTPSKGDIHYHFEGIRNPDKSDLITQTAFAAPYISLIQELTLAEMIDFHFRFRKMLVANAHEMLHLNGLAAHINKPIGQFSSGMIQRLKLSLAIMSDTPVLLLDEPTSNLDAQGCQWYQDMLLKFKNDRILIIGSNQPHEYELTNAALHVPDYKVPKKQ